MSAMSTLGLSVEVLLRVTNLREGPLPITSFDLVIRKKKNIKWRKEWLIKAAKTAEKHCAQCCIKIHFYPCMFSPQI